MEKITGTFSPPLWMLDCDSGAFSAWDVYCGKAGNQVTVVYNFTAARAGTSDLGFVSV